MMCVTHEMGFARKVANRVIFMDKGQIVEDDSKDAFFRYLRLLLSELGDPFAAALAAQDGSGQGAWRAASDDAPILEEMVRAFCRGGDQLRAIERLIARLETGDGDHTDPIPAEFRALWNTFRIALATQDAAHAE